ncbi:MAG: PD40 domain-containing protein, partial [Gemmatimonadetes bacterium]|nr:PD40 domain-containing protein [Gemmatimonadota bacterium]
IEVIFTEPITATSATPQNIRLLEGSRIIPATLIRSWDGTRVEVVPEEFLRPSATYAISLTTGISDLSGGELQQPFSSEFTTVSEGAHLAGAMVFESKRSGQSEIWIMDDDGSNPLQLTRRVAEGGAATGPALSPDGRKVVFSAWPSGEEWEIYLINVDGTGLTNLTSHPAFDGWRPAWSPDGSKISFFSTRDDPANDEIYVMNSDGTGVIRLTENPADDANSTWSPDGSKIAFETNRGGDYDIYVMNADGSNPRPLTTHPADDEWPAWSPDGSKIAFDSWRDGDREIYVMDADGSNVVRLTFDEGQDSAPAWSRDGTKIAFVSGRGGSVDIWVMNADGSGVMRLTDHPGADFFPSWSQ